MDGNEKMSKMNAFTKRGVIYISISLAGLLYEFIFMRPLRPVSILLWLGVAGLAVLVIVSFRDTHE